MGSDVIAANPLAYEILDECKYGREEFFVLVSSIDYSDVTQLQQFTDALLRLTQYDLLAVYQGNQPMTTFDEAVLNRYLEMRVLAGESLDEPPNVCDELAFATTDAGAAILKPEDRP